MLHTLAPLLYSNDDTKSKRDVTSPLALSLITEKKIGALSYNDFYGTLEHRDEPFFNSSNLSIVLGL
jgi:hypothetical protein